MTYATPGQGGHNHVNEQNFEYWHNVMKDNNFEFLENETMRLRQIALVDGKEYNPLYNDNHFYHRGLLFKNLKFSQQGAEQ
jgi:hypothetical protein